MKKKNKKVNMTLGFDALGKYGYFKMSFVFHLTW
jgi:hypothetical protein